MHNGETAIEGCIIRRRFILEKTCQESVGHKHNYDHMTMCVVGGIKVTIRDDDDKILSENDYYPGHDPIHIAKHLHHTIKALMDGTVYFCMFPQRDFNGIVVERYMGNIGAAG